MSAKLNELAERVERAEAGSRELEADIWRSLGNCVHEMRLGRVEVEPGEYDVVSQCTHCGDFKGIAPPRFTRSIDAAMKLVPEGWHTSLVLQDRHSRRWAWELRGGYGLKAFARADAPAIALTAAALRSKAASQ